VFQALRWKTATSSRARYKSYTCVLLST
jgi:hypothetical protein